MENMYTGEIQEMTLRILRNFLSNANDLPQVSWYENILFR